MNNFAHTKKNYIHFFLFFFLIFSLLSYRYYINGGSYFDLGSYLNKILRIENGYFFEAIKGHFSPILIIISIFTKIISINFKPYILFILQSICLAFPLLMIKEKYRLIYFFSPIIWSASQFDFHVDTLGIPFLFLFFYSRDTAHKFFYAILLCLIKEIFIFILLTGSVYFLFIKQKKFFLYIFLLSLFFLALFIIANYNVTTHEITEPNRFSHSQNFKLNNISKFFHFKILAITFIFFIFYFKNLSKEVLVFLIPLIIIFTENINHIKPWFHYYLCIVPISIYFIDKLNLDKKDLKIILTIGILFNILISHSPISLRFLFLKDNYYHFSNFQKKNQITIDQNILDKINLNDFVLIQNNAYYSNFHKTLFMLPLGNSNMNGYKENIYFINKFKLDKKSYKFQYPKYVILNNNKSFFEEDRLCENCYEKINDKLNKNYQLIYENNEFKVYSIKLF